MQFRCRKSQEITTDGIADADFTVIVRMGAGRVSDQFYIVPSRVIFEALSAHRTASLPTQKDLGHWVLRWREHRSGEVKPNYGFEKKWTTYLNAWDGLEGAV